MRLIEAIAARDTIAKETFLCVRKPWGHDAEAILVPFTNDLSIPQHIKAQGYEYFLGFTTMNEILEGFDSANRSLEWVTDFLTYYAQYDAYPDWAYDPTPGERDA